MKSLCTAFALMLLSSFEVTAAPARPPNGFLYADMSFTMFCEKAQIPQLESKIENFLRQEGFKVLNYAQIQHGRFDLHVGGMDSRGHIVEIKNFVGMPGRYGVILWTEPLMPRATDLEAKLEQFAGSDLNCPVRFLERKQNSSLGSYLFNDKVIEIENLIQLAEGLKKNDAHITTESTMLLEQRLIGIWRSPPPVSGLIQFFPDHKVRLYFTKDEGQVSGIRFVDGTWNHTSESILMMKFVSGEKWIIRQCSIGFENGEMMLDAIRHVRINGDIPPEYSW